MQKQREEGIGVNVESIGPVSTLAERRKIYETRTIRLSGPLRVYDWNASRICSIAPWRIISVTWRMKQLKCTKEPLLQVRLRVESRQRPWTEWCEGPEEEDIEHIEQTTIGQQLDARFLSLHAGRDQQVFTDLLQLLK